jgi:hypothetical protein
MPGAGAGDDVHRAGERAHSRPELLGVYRFRVQANFSPFMRTF